MLLLWLRNGPSSFGWRAVFPLTTVALPETYIAPQTLLLEDEFPFEKASWQVLCWFRGGYCKITKTETKKQKHNSGWLYDLWIPMEQLIEETTIRSHINLTLHVWLFSPIDDWLHPAAFLYYTWKAFLLAASFVVATVISKAKHGAMTEFWRYTSQFGGTCIWNVWSLSFRIGNLYRISWFPDKTQICWEIC